MIQVLSKGVLRTNYKELIILPTVYYYYLPAACIVFKSIIASFSVHWGKRGKNNLSDAD